MNSLRIVPDEASELVGRRIAARLPVLVDLIHAGNLLGQIGMDELDLLSGLVGVTGAHEMLVWARAERSYGVAWTSLAPEDEVIEAATAAPEEGLVWKVFATGRSVVQTADELHTDGWTNLERRRGRTVGGMAGSPVIAAGKCAAALTLVQYRDDGPGTSIAREGAALLGSLASLLGQSLEDRLIRASLGLETL